MSETEFTSAGTVCRGFHFPPAGGGAPPPQGAPCVLLGHGFGGTWRSGLEPFAHFLAQRGFHAVTFDYRFLGGSDGTPRQLVSVRKQLADWRAALAHVRGMAGIDPERVYLWGASLGGGHVIRTGATDGRVAGVIALAPILDGLGTLARIARTAGPGSLAHILGAGVWDLLAGLRGREPRPLPIVGPPGTLAALTTPDAEPGYRAITGPDWQNRFCARIALTIAGYRPGRWLSRLSCPVLIQIPRDDTILPHRATTRHLRRLGPQGRVRYYPGGHFDVFLGERFAAVAQDQEAFLGDPAPAAAAAPAQGVGKETQ